MHNVDYNLLAMLYNKFNLFHNSWYYKPYLSELLLFRKCKFRFSRIIKMLLSTNYVVDKVSNENVTAGHCTACYNFIKVEQLFFDGLESTVKFLIDFVVE